jgi:acyl-CoA thioesterase FadM
MLIFVRPMPVEAHIHDSNPYEVKSKGSSEKKAPARFWYPTVLLNIDFKKSLPAEGVEWLFVRVNTKQIKNGRLDLDIVIMDEGGEIVALSNHVGLALDSSRNLAVRKTGSKI